MSTFLYLFVRRTKTVFVIQIVQVNVISELVYSSIFKMNVTHQIISGI